MRSSLPNWIGWPGSGPAPGHDWLPGPVLRLVVLALVYGFLALSLTVNYAASVSFFLLAIIGIYVGLRRGFVNGLSSVEKWVMVVFAAYPAVAIASYLAGVQTNVGFRFLGRDLRFLLFIPAFLAVKWSRPRRLRVGLALAAGASGALVLALIQHYFYQIPQPQGMAGWHISFGDLSLVSGVLGFPLLLSNLQIPRSLKDIARFSAITVTTLGAGFSASVISGARGGWLSVPFFAAVFTLLWPGCAAHFRIWRRLSVLALCLTALCVLAFLTPRIRNDVERAVRDAHAYWVVEGSNAEHDRCVEEKPFLRALIGASGVSGDGKVKIIKLPENDRKSIARFGCVGGYALRLTKERNTPGMLNVSLFRGRGRLGKTMLRRQSASVLVKGSGRFNVGIKGTWSHINTYGRWRIYKTSQSYDWLGAARTDLRISSGQKMLVIPIQVPRGIYAQALTTTSVGLRLQMWAAAWSLFLKNPILGFGAGGFHAATTSVRHASSIYYVGTYEHAHSDYMTSLGTKGVLGLIALIALWLVPSYAVYKTRSYDGSPFWLLASLVLTIGFAAFGATETMFIHSLVISWYVISVAVIISLTDLRSENERV